MAPRSVLLWPSLAFLTAGLLSLGPVRIHAQSSTATCLDSFSWMDNSKNQSPCLLAAYLQASCTGDQFSVSALPNNTHYTGPYADESNPCQCSTVTYNAISACGLCQNRTIISWTSWDTNCTTVYPDVYPPGVPAGTAIPQWAFQDVTTSNMFNVTLAFSVGDSPESTASVTQSTATAITSTTHPASITQSPSPSSSTSPSNSLSTGSKTNTGAIAGGVVGGVVGLALIVGAVIFFVMRKRRSQVPPSAQFAGLASPGYPPPAPYSPQMAQKLYDPSDPSTFPASPPPASGMTASSTYVQSYSAPSVQAGGVYSGAPEV